MEFQEAAIKLEEMAGGRYHSLYYKMSKLVSGEYTSECTLYIDGYGFSSNFTTWPDAFGYMRQVINRIDSLPQRRSNDHG